MHSAELENIDHARASRRRKIAVEWALAAGLVLLLLVLCWQLLSMSFRTVVEIVAENPNPDSTFILTQYATSTGPPADWTTVFSIRPADTEFSRRSGVVIALVDGYSGTAITEIDWSSPRVVLVTFDGAKRYLNDISLKPSHAKSSMV